MRSLARVLLLTAVGASSLLPCAAQAPDATQPPANQHEVLTVQGRGSQVYSCQQVDRNFQWVFQAPVARLFDAAGSEVGTHGDGPIWVYQDSSSIRGTLVKSVPSAEAGSIPWLLLKATSPQRSGVLTSVEFIRRSDTHGGIAPTTGCDATHRGEIVRAPYTATYTFYSSTAAKS
jgi:hypothetical protein